MRHHSIRSCNQFSLLVMTTCFTVHRVTWIYVYTYSHLRIYTCIHIHRYTLTHAHMHAYIHIRYNACLRLLLNYGQTLYYGQLFWSRLTHVYRSHECVGAYITVTPELRSKYPKRLPYCLYSCTLLWAYTYIQAYMHLYASSSIWPK